MSKCNVSKVHLIMPLSSNVVPFSEDTITLQQQLIHPIIFIWLKVNEN